VVVARFDGECMSSDGGLLALREVENRLDIGSRLAAGIRDPRDPSRVVHGLDEIIRTRMHAHELGAVSLSPGDLFFVEPLGYAGPALFSTPLIRWSETTTTKRRGTPAAD
jgi:hypothetical protein